MRAACEAQPIGCSEPVLIRIAPLRRNRRWGLLASAALWVRQLPFARIVAAAQCGIADLKTVTALTSNEMKSAFVKAGPIAARYRSAGPRPAASASAQTETALIYLRFPARGSRSSNCHFGCREKSRG
jgi:hypothetical protein